MRKDNWFQNQLSPHARSVHNELAPGLTFPREMAMR